MAMKTGQTREKTSVILDSNALFVPVELRIDIFQELRTLLNRNFELVILEPVVEELKRLEKEGAPRMRRKASCALKLAEQGKKLIVKQGAVSPDDVILETASKHHWPVFTNDRALRRKLRNINVPVIYVRQKSRLEIDGRL
jgi:rRNA-processing protein FCF1